MDRQWRSTLFSSWSFVHVQQRIWPLYQRGGGASDSLPTEALQTASRASKRLADPEKNPTSSSPTMTFSTLD